jgi:putative membrane protein
MQETDSAPQRPLPAIRIFFTGFAMGIADLIPGVSGGTMALCTSGCSPRSSPST